MTSSPPIDSRFQQVFAAQKKASREQPYPILTLRLDNLSKLEKLLTDHQMELAEAICVDYGNRPTQETRVVEIYGLLSGIRYAKKRLKKWMKPQRRHVALVNFGAQNKVLPQPKGVIGVVTPWNYPLFLSLSPAISALAAGNRCIIKIAANTQTLANSLNKRVSEVFDEDTLAVMPGVSADEFTHMPWDHLVFTGSAQTATTVMETAAKTLTPVTLELGGKSPTIIDESFNLKTAARRLSFVKFLNAGQTCVAPDHVFVPRARLDEFVAAMTKIVRKRYTDASSRDYTSLIDGRAYNRIVDTMEDAQSKGAQLINLLGGDAKLDAERKVAPHILLNTNDDMRVMQEEIFGPLLPVIAYDTIDEVIALINARERPLGLYLFSNNKALQQPVTLNTLSGGLSISGVIVDPYDVDRLMNYDPLAEPMLMQARRDRAAQPICDIV